MMRKIYGESIQDLGLGVALLGCVPTGERHSRNDVRFLKTRISQAEAKSGKRLEYITSF